MRLVLEKIISNGLYKYLLFDNFQIEKVNTLDIEKIKSYYNQIRSEDLCDCDYCRNNIHEVEAAYICPSSPEKAPQNLRHYASETPVYFCSAS